MLRIAIDWDDTYTADPGLWDAFIEFSKAKGHWVCICTCRRDNDENREIVVPRVDVPVYFTGHASKRWYMEQRNLPIDIWIDDKPETVKEGR